MLHDMDELGVRVKGKKGSHDCYVPCVTMLREYARKLGHVPGRGRFGPVWGHCRCVCVRCGAVIRMKPAQLQARGFRHFPISGCSAVDLGEGI